MGSVSDTFREGAMLLVATADTHLDTWLTALEARINAMSGANSTQANGTISFSVECENAASATYTFKQSVTFDTGVVAAGTALTHCQSVVTALDAFADAVEAASAYTTVTDVSVTASVTMSN